MVAHYIAGIGIGNNGAWEALRFYNTRLNDENKDSIDAIEISIWTLRNFFIGNS